MLVQHQTTTTVMNKIRHPNKNKVKIVLRIDFIERKTNITSCLMGEFKHLELILIFYSIVIIFCKLYYLLDVTRLKGTLKRRDLLYCRLWITYGNYWKLSFRLKILNSPVSNGRLRIRTPFVCNLYNTLYWVTGLVYMVFRVVPKVSYGSPFSLSEGQMTWLLK